MNRNLCTDRMCRRLVRELRDDHTQFKIEESVKRKPVAYDGVDFWNPVLEAFPEVCVTVHAVQNSCKAHAICR